MKRFFEIGALALVLATVVAVAGIVFLVMMVALIANAVGGLANWVLAFAILFGVQLGMGEMLGIAALMLIIICAVTHYASDTTRRFFDGLGFLMFSGLLSITLVAMCGLPGWLVAHFFSHGKASGWWVFPIGVATIIVAVVIEKAKKIRTNI